MKEYTFFMSKGFRTRHVLANNLRMAIQTTIKYYDGTTVDRRGGKIIFDMYQMCKKGDFIMSGWLHSQDKNIKGLTI